METSKVTAGATTKLNNKQIDTSSKRPASRPRIPVMNITSSTGLSSHNTSRLPTPRKRVDVECKTVPKKVVINLENMGPFANDTKESSKEEDIKSKHDTSKTSAGSVTERPKCTPNKMRQKVINKNGDNILYVYLNE